jgi:superoxide dismutase, Cu-Zn family
MEYMFVRMSLATVAITLGACATQVNYPAARANLQPTKGNTAMGVVTFRQGADRVFVSGEITGLKPNSEHGFHIHEKGDCSSGDGMSAGGHFNPTSQPHGDANGMPHHAGDLLALKSDANGVAKFSFESTSISVGTGVTNVVGRGLIVHRDADDFKTQPTGNSGPRIACAVIAQN